MIILNNNNYNNNNNNNNNHTPSSSSSSPPAFYPLPSIDEPNVLQLQLRIGCADDGELTGVQMRRARLELPALSHSLTTSRQS